MSPPAGKRHVFFTGQPGVGKTTAVLKIVQALASNHDMDAIARGFYTEECRAGGERIGFDVVTLAGSRGPLARVAGAGRGGPAVGKYAVDVRSFEALALPQLTPSAGAQLYVIDEVGKMELFSRAFYPAVQALLDEAPLVLGTVPVARQGRAIPQVEAIKQRPDVQVITLTRENRDRETQAVLAELQRRLQSRGGSGGGSDGG
ncbi:hypothetical protein COHA_001502 [Chlorella ohadii]|uniref:AAA+ ATPase domain-containing protein n=1 Tax=Chlorella ohadii TaxID=2649997 RepID=A0AAD5H881_9CHLO|nr:hypothetical protein COHA_001502 [Chlorella ohadii]